MQISISRINRNVDSEAELQRILLNACFCVSIIEIIDTFRLLRMAELTKILASWKNRYTHTYIYDWIKQLRQIARWISAQWRRTGVYSLACTEAGRHSISDLMPPLAFALQRFVSSLAPHAFSLYLSFASLIYSSVVRTHPFPLVRSSMCTNEQNVFQKHAFVTTAVWPSCRRGQVANS